MPTLFEHAGGEQGLHRLEDLLLQRLRDPLLQPLFGEGQPEHVEHLTISPPSPSVARTASAGSSASRI